MSFPLLSLDHLNNEAFSVSRHPRRDSLIRFTLGAPLAFRRMCPPNSFLVASELLATVARASPRRQILSSRASALIASSRTRCRSVVISISGLVGVGLGNLYPCSIAAWNSVPIVTPRSSLGSENDFHRLPHSPLRNLSDFSDHFSQAGNIASPR